MAVSIEERSAILVSLSKGTIDNGQVMSFAPPEGSAADALASLCAGQGMDRVLVVSDGSPDALEKKALFESSAQEAGLSVLPAQAYSLDFSSSALLINGYVPQAIIVLAADSGSAAQIVNSLHSHKINAEIVGDPLLISPEALSLMGENAEGIYALDSGPDYEEGGLSYFLNEYSFAYGEPHDAELVLNSANALYLLAQAQDFYSYRATPQDFKNYWSSLESWEGLGGALFFEHGDRTSPFREVTVSGGSIEVLP
jgi:ABC-type branched-subunit amino acid transport system substrate-binding protein